MQINITQAAGLLAFIIAILAAVAAFWRTSRGARVCWGAIVAIYLLLTLEVLAMLRHHSNLVAGEWLKAEGIYAERRPAQAAILMLTMLLAALVLGFVIRKARGRAQAIAIGATAAVILLFVIESISLHAVDAILYRHVGPVMLIAWLWLACGLTTAVAAALYRK